MTSIEFAAPEPEQAETELRVKAEYGTRVLLSADGKHAHMYLVGSGFSGSAWFTPESARELGNHLLLCADVLEKA